MIKMCLVHHKIPISLELDKQEVGSEKDSSWHSCTSPLFSYLFGGTHLSFRLRLPVDLLAANVEVPRIVALADSLLFARNKEQRDPGKECALLAWQKAKKQKMPQNAVPQWLKITNALVEH